MNGVDNSGVSVTWRKKRQFVVTRIVDVKGQPKQVVVVPSRIRRAAWQTRFEATEVKTL